VWTLASIKELYRHMEWADARVWRAVLDSETALVDVAVVEKLRHLHRTQQYFLKVWRGEEIIRDKGGFTLDEELTFVRSYYEALPQWVDSVTEEMLASELSLPWADYFAQRAGAERAHPTTLGETMMQLAAHSTYHRGQMNMLLRQLGSAPPLTDYIGWLWLGRPEPEWA
jgi:uncharacterized damage-inducible protein DinB